MQSLAVGTVILRMKTRNVSHVKVIQAKVMLVNRRRTDEHTLLTRSTEKDLVHDHVHHVHVQNGFSIIDVLGQVSQSDLGTMKANSFEVFYTSKFEVKL